MVRQSFKPAIRCSFLLIAMTSLLQPLNASPLQTLDSFLWENRLIVIAANSPQVDQLLDQLEAARADIEERHIVWFIDDGKRLFTNYSGQVSNELSTVLQSRWSGEELSKLQVVLIGKDGGTKLRLRELDLPTMFTTIDGMPMRQAEMRRAAGN